MKIFHLGNGLVFRSPFNTLVGSKSLTNSLSLVIVLLILLLTGVLGQRFYSQPQLAVNSLALETIKAPRSANFIDSIATEQKRKEAQHAIAPVLHRDNRATESILFALKQKLKRIEMYRKRVGNFPYLPTTILSRETQQSLALLGNSSSENFNHPLFLEIEQSLWRKLSRRIEASAKMILTQGLTAGLSPELVKETVKLHLADFNSSIQNESASFLADFLKNHSNLIEDKLATELMTRDAVNTVKPVVVSINKGETIVQSGKLITSREFTLLDGFNLSRRAVNFVGLIWSLVLVSLSFCLLVCLSSLLERRKLRSKDYVLIFLFSVSVLIFNILDAHYSSLPAVGLLISSFYGPILAVTQVISLTGLSFYALENPNWQNLLACLVSGIIAAAIGGKLRCRDELAILGLCMGIAQGATYLLVHIIFSGISLQAAVHILMPTVLLQSCIGLAWAIVAIGISPYLERMFDLVTPIRLAEISHPNCPLLKRLAIEAPGTFQHTLAVSCLAESAARALDCNVELVRAGTLYHDIGKMHDPQGFIENQKNGINKHDLIKDPWISADIIKKHVTQGLIMARRYGLPQVVQDFIPQHQGTILIAYFYYQAQQTGKQVDQAYFRYAGPIPQSRETAIVMLADACEAALRSFKDVKPELAISTVKKILHARWQEGQLSESGLIYDELATVAGVFVEVWQQFNHSRSAYPTATLDLNSK